MATLPIEQLMATAGEFVAQVKAGAAKQQVIAEQQSAGMTRVAGIYDTVAQDMAVVKATEQAAQLKVQQKNAATAVAAGVDINASADRLTDLHLKLKKANDDTLKSVNEQKELAGKRFLDAPVDYIIAQFRLPGVEEEVKANAAASQATLQVLTAENNALQESVQTTEKLRESVTATSAASATRIAAAQALVNSEQANIDARKFNSEGIRLAENATKEQLAAEYNVFNAQKSEQQAVMAQKSFALQTEKFEWEKEERKLLREAREENKQVDEVSLSYVNRSLTSLGMPEMTPLEFKQAKALNKPDLAYHYDNGRRSIATGTATVGASPAESLKVLTSVQSNLPQLRKDTAAVLLAAKEMVGASKTINHKDPAAVESAINGFVNQQIAAQYTSISPGSDNLFNIGDLSSYINLSAVKDLPVVSKVLAPLAAQGQKLDDPKLVLGFMYTAIKRGELTTSQVADLSTVYQLANNVNQQARGFAGYGIIPPNAGKNYFAKVSSFGKPVDMTNPTEVQKYFAKEAAAEIQIQRQGQRRGAF